MPTPNKPAAKIERRCMSCHDHPKYRNHLCSECYAGVEAFNNAMRKMNARQRRAPRVHKLHLESGRV